MTKNAELFQKNKYIYLKNAIEPTICKIAAQYGIFDSVADFHLDDKQVLGSHSKYADPLMEALLLHALPIMEEATGLKLLPTYSFYRTYKPGNELPIHVDRPSCEISASLCLGFRYVHEDEAYKWGLWIGDTEHKMEVGDLAIYRGMEVDHWREPMEGEKGTWQVQAFLHYVEAKGTYAFLKYDTRPSLGLPEAFQDRPRLDDAAFIRDGIEIPDVLFVARGD